MIVLPLAAGHSISVRLTLKTVTTVALANSGRPELLRMTGLGLSGRLIRGIGRMAIENP